MPTMSRIEAAWCRSAPWRAFARRLVLPWSLQGFEPTGRVLEVGAGSGAMASELLATHRGIKMTVTDFDPEMVDAAAERLAPFEDRVVVRQADATELPFEDGSFDAVLSWIMLHHTIEWEKAISEMVRVTRPGGHVVGYDLVSSAPFRLMHQAEGSRSRMLQVSELRDVVRGLSVGQAVLTPSLGGTTVRFLLQSR
jgi:ubiquinone/menaquinone biosynthesis C-methylase UbiE